MEFNFPQIIFLFNLLGAILTLKILLNPHRIIEFKISKKYLLQFSKNAEFWNFKEKKEGTKVKLQEI